MHLSSAASAGFLVLVEWQYVVLVLTHQRATYADHGRTVAASGVGLLFIACNSRSDWSFKFSSPALAWRPATGGMGAGNVRGGRRPPSAGTGARDRKVCPSLSPQSCLSRTAHREWPPSTSDGRRGRESLLECLTAAKLIGDDRRLEVDVLLT